MLRTLSLLTILIGGSLALGNIPDSSQIAGPALKDGQEVTCDLAPSQQFKNIGSRLDDAGMCVWSSIEMAALYQGLERMRGCRDWWAAKFTGGGWPDRVPQFMAAWAKHKNITIPPWYQYEGRDPEEIMALLDHTRRMACITYGWSPRYGEPISHMVCAPRFNGDYGVVLDNNFVATKRADGTYDEKIFEWMPRPELVRRMKLSSGSAWVFAWLTPPPPPPARHKLALSSKFTP